MELSLPKVLNIIGLALNLVGVVILFRYGMPYRVRSEEVILTFSAGRDESGKTDDFYGLLGKIGLTLIVVGTILQAAATLSV